MKAPDRNLQMVRGLLVGCSMTTTNAMANMNSNISSYSKRYTFNAQFNVETEVHTLLADFSLVLIFSKPIEKQYYAQ
ncbi:MULTISPECIES: hypothetical protein [Photorhabdus]|uniref:hypothetical protein n=1 Tax=Photorhabdus TaxID=29487 RepID=UPI000DCCE35B|nr:MULTISPECIES: hypothetical protein [Photorhabdus]MCT8342701.1 hypothetical protein [Photorhabdus kleinii]RAW97122.1 hypothetical protein CKY05_13970 [Photorhabdus sp. S10-54]RAW97177.1 hypothetical protein CKY03_13650 [Photorhabdus sp. S9-53]RAX01684.1 hypothetical protein CKY04_13620 [Photorhabdus sp. S8-52]